MAFRNTLGACLLLIAVVSFSRVAAEPADSLHFNAVLSGAQVVPAVETGARALIQVTFDPAFTQIDIRFETLANLNVTSAQMHCGLAGEDGPVALNLLGPGPLLEIRNGTRVTLDQTHIGGTGCQFAIGRPVNNIVALAFAMRQGQIYVTLGTAAFPGGELRGQFLSVAETGELDQPDDRLTAPFPR
jgi:hypothetical protein